MSETEFKISVIIPAYNSASYICRAIDSVLAQTFPAHEIIVVDDGSTDTTSDKVASYGDRVRLIRQLNAGPGAARNRGIEAATGNWIAFLDADDEYLPDRLKSSVELLESNPDLAWCAGNYIKYLDKNNMPDTTYHKSDSVVYDDFFQALLKGDFVCTITVLVKKTVLLDCGLFRTDIRYGEDTDLWWRLGYSYPAYGYIRQPLAIYYMDISGSLARSKRTYQTECDLIGRHLALAKRADALARFQPVAKKRVKDWIRGAKFDQRIYDIDKMLDEFAFLLEPLYKVRIKLLTLFPTLTMKLFQLLSHINRKYKIRKKNIHPRD